MRPLLLLLALALAAPAAAAPMGTIVAFGDSITKGMVPTPWPDVLRERLHARFPMGGVSVVNAGIGGNQLLGSMPDISGKPAGVARFARDALGPKDVRIVILLQGINDIGGLDLARAKGAPDAAQRDLAAEIVAGYRSLIAQAHARGIKLYGGTLTPFKGAGYYSADGEAVRQKVNHWIRTAGAFDAVIDFDAALRDPKNPARLRHDYDLGDHLHPSLAGEAAMADAIDLSTLE